MRALVLLHRWLGVAFCFLFAMWFATGIVMHFVPFPALTEAERIAGLGVIDPAQVRFSAGAAAAGAHLMPARMRLIMRADGPVFILQSPGELAAVSAVDLAPARVDSPARALAIAIGHARNRGLQVGSAKVLDVANYDQWTVANGFDRHRPLHRIALGDDAGTELYVSPRTGEVVLDTTRFERAWNYVGSVAHWIYPTVLRRDVQTWNATVWTLSFAACIAAVSGVLVGLLRLRVSSGRLTTPFTGWQAWHHWLGLASMIFVLTWIVSGWLSMDHGRLFSTREVTPTEASRVQGLPDWVELTRSDVLPAGAREIEWFAFNAAIYRRDRFDVASQRLAPAGDAPRASGVYLSADQITRAVRRLSRRCAPAVQIDAADPYAVPSPARAPVYRVICDEVWFHMDAADGRLLERLDSSRRAYRWLYSAMHTLDFHPLVALPAVRNAIIVALCLLGLVFSVTAVVIGWRRVTR